MDGRRGNAVDHESAMDLCKTTGDSKSLFIDSERRSRPHASSKHQNSKAEGSILIGDGGINDDDRKTTLSKMVDGLRLFPWWKNRFRRYHS